MLSYILPASTDIKIIGRGPAKWALDFETPSNEGDNQEEKPTEENNNPVTDKEEADYSEEQYPPADDKYK